MATVDCTTPISSLGSTYIRGLDVYSNRGQGNARIENVDFAFEVARQEKRSGSQRGKFLDAGYTFADLPWQPTVSYRFSRFSEGWDFLFQADFHGRCQRVVAVKYAGSVTSNIRINDILL